MTGASLQGKIDRLASLLREMAPIAVAFSGGVDSTFLLSTARRSLADGVIGITAVNPFFTAEETRRALRIAGDLGVPVLQIRADPLENADIVANGPDRCYHCKRFLYNTFLSKLAEMGGYTLVHGVNTDDLKDYRPGNHAADELGVAAPLVEAGLGKVEIREASRRMRLETHDLPSNACLASRIPYHTPVSAQRLRQIEQAEGILERMGFGACRVRHHGDLARIELASVMEIQRAVGGEMRNRLIRRLKPVGFRFLSLDLEGYRQGSMNRVL